MSDRSLEEMEFEKWWSSPEVMDGPYLSLKEGMLLAWNTRSRLSPVQGEELPELEPKCPLCKGSGKVERFGLSSAGDMDVGNEPHKIQQSCRGCSGCGFLYLPADELTQLLRTALAEIKRLSQPPAGLPERPQRTSERFVSAFPVEQTEAYFAALEAEVARLKGERDRMRDLLIESGKAAGGFLLYAVSAEFLAHIPEEIRLALSSSRADALKEWKHAVDEARDAILNERYGMAEQTFDGDQVNAVLGIIDDYAYPPEQAILAIGGGK